MFSGQIDSLYLFLPFYCGSFVLGCQTLSKQIECFIFFEESDLRNDVIKTKIKQLRQRKLCS